jgi:hypothetical protein
MLDELKKVLLKLGNRTGELCVGILYGALWTDVFFSRESFLSAAQARDLYTYVKDRTTICDPVVAEKIIFHSVYDYWNLSPEDSILYCSLSSRGHDKPSSEQELAETLDAIKKNVCLSVPCRCSLINMMCSNIGEKE